MTYPFPRPFSASLCHSRPLAQGAHPWVQACVSMPGREGVICRFHVMPRVSWKRSHPVEGAKHPKPTRAPIRGPQWGDTSVLRPPSDGAVDSSQQTLVLETAQGM